MMAMIWTWLAAAIKSSQADPGYTYKGTNSFNGSEVVGTMEHRAALEVGTEVGATVGAEVGAAVGAVVGFVVGTTVGFVVGTTVGFVVGTTVGFVVGTTVGFVVGAVVGFVVGAEVAAEGGDWVEDDPP
jgi:hypothetical protein